jgi:hypothetical protein
MGIYGNAHVLICIYYWNLQTLNNVIMIKTKVHISQSYESSPILHPFDFLLPKTFSLFCFELSFDRDIVPDEGYSRHVSCERFIGDI